MILLYIFEWLLVLVLLSVLILFFMWMYFAFRAKVPFVPVPHAILSDVHKALQIKEGSVVYRH
jgi:nicotinamide riboside transporter PnuC